MDWKILGNILTNSGLPCTTTWDVCKATRASFEKWCLFLYLAFTILAIRSIASPWSILWKMNWSWIHFGILSIRYQTYNLRYFSSVYPGKGISTRLSFNLIPNGLGSVFNSQQITVFAGHISGIPDCSISLIVSSVLVYWIVISDDNRAPL